MQWGNAARDAANVSLICLLFLHHYHQPKPLSTCDAPQRAMWQKGKTPFQDSKWTSHWLDSSCYLASCTTLGTDSLCWVHNDNDKSNSSVNSPEGGTSQSSERKSTNNTISFSPETTCSLSCFNNLNTSVHPCAEIDISEGPRAAWEKATNLCLERKYIRSTFPLVKPLSQLTLNSQNSNVKHSWRDHSSRVLTHDHRGQVLGRVAREENQLFSQLIVRPPPSPAFNDGPTQHIGLLKKNDFRESEIWAKTLVWNWVSVDNFISAAATESWPAHSLFSGTALPLSQQCNN